MSLEKSRTLQLLEREYHALKKANLWASLSIRQYFSTDGQGIEVDVIDGNYFQWSASIIGPVDTPWEGGLFQLELQFDNEYDEMPPTVKFLTVPFHPNIDMKTGRPCVEFLDSWQHWLPSAYSVETILVYLQFLLGCPSMDSPVNVAAAEAFLYSQHLYEQLAKDCVLASLGLKEAVKLGERASRPATRTRIVIETPPARAVDKKERPKVYRVSYDDYLSTWQSIATTLPAGIRDSDGSKKQLRQVYSTVSNFIGESNNSRTEGAQPKKAPSFAEMLSTAVRSSLQALKESSNPNPPTESTATDASQVPAGEADFVVNASAVQLAKSPPSSKPQSAKLVRKKSSSRLASRGSQRSVTADSAAKKDQWEGEAEELMEWTRALDDKQIEV